MTDDHSKAIAVVERHDVERVNPAIRAIMEARLDPETARKMLEVQREWEAGEARKAFVAAKTALMRDMPTVLDKDKPVDYPSKQGGRVQYRHTTLAHAWREVIPHLITHGFAIHWVPGNDDSKVEVTCVLTHAQGHSERCTMSAPFDTSGGKNAIQGRGSTASYLERYTAMALLGIVSADMPEPTGEPAPDRVDKARNQKAIGWLTSKGKTRAEAEAALGTPWDEWTSTDLDALKEWVKETDTRKPAGVE